jgi:hypothetical protein
LLLVNYVVVFGVALHDNAADYVHSNTQHQIDDDRIEENGDVAASADQYIP